MGDHELPCYLAKLEYRHVDHADHDVTVTAPILVILLALWLELRSHIDSNLCGSGNDDDFDDYDDHGKDVQVVMPGFPVQTLGSHQPPPYSPSR